jgi:hypothetical protein
MNVPGKSDIHGAFRKWTRESLRIPPSVGTSGGTPTPRKLSADSARTAMARMYVCWTSSGASELGKRWWVMMRGALPPCALPPNSRA